MSSTNLNQYNIFNNENSSVPNIYFLQNLKSSYPSVSSDNYELDPMLNPHRIINKCKNLNGTNDLKYV